MLNSIKVREKETGKVFDAWCWTGDDFQPEDFQTFGFFEDDNGYDLYCCTHDFITEPNRRKGYLKMDEWVIKDENGKYSLMSGTWFKDHYERIKETPNE